ncbi:DUF885 domain-containing protein [Luteimonas vadosa]|uniref:DUF885 domain-containing protein n=2 Tax=Luteimonas vadosa TaxID=1165507 RepID=A0ABP9DXV8_9GAMM
MRWTGIAFGLLLLAVLLLVAHTIWMKPLKIGWFYERVFAEFALENPEMMSRLRMLPPWLDWYSDDLTDVSPAQQERFAGQVREALDTLRSYDRGALPADKRIDYDVLEYFLATQVEGQRFRFHDYPLNQLHGLQNTLPEFLANTHQVKSPGEADDYLARLGKIPAKFDQLLEGLRLRESRGIVPPTFVVEKVLAGMRAFVAVPPEQNVLYTSFEERLAAPGMQGVDDAAREELLAAARAAIADKVYPAYRQLIDYYAALLPRTEGNRGVWALPDGDAYYAWSVRQQTTTDMTPAQVHALGLSEVARISAEMDAILRTQGLDDGSIGERMLQLAQRPDQRYPDTPEARARILADYQAIIDEIDGGLEPYFDVRPKAGVKVEPVPAFREKTAPGAYYNAPAFDGSRPGIFHINLRDLGEIQKFGMRTLAYHEAIPGHHFQIAIQQELTGVPTFRRVLPFTAFSEGWALYAERLAWELGFQERPLDNLGRLQGELFRAVRLVVDTGMHHKRWTREQAIDYMTDKTGMPQSDVVAEIERYLVMPGQALAYKVGMNKILELRARATAALGDKFDIRRFHTLVLTGGPMPMTLLERRVDAWIAAERER